MFRIAGVERVLYVSDVLLADVSAPEIPVLFQRYDLANELWEVGNHPLLFTTNGPLVILEWLGPHELTEGEIRLHAPDKGGVYILVEPLEAGRWKPFFVDRHERLSSQLQLFAQTKEFGRVRCFFSAAIGTGVPSPEIVRDRVTKFIAEACEIDDPTDPRLKPLAVNLPSQVVAKAV